MDFYRGYFHSIVVFSPTVKNDEKWEWLKTQKILGKNSKLDCFIKEQLNEIRGSESEGLVNRGASKTDQIKELEKYLTPPEFDGKVSEDFFLETYSEETLREILIEQKTLIHLLKKFGKTKHVANRILLVFDDLVGSSLFSNNKKNAFKMLNTNHRHYSCSILEVTQAYKEIPRTVRTNFSCLILFEIPNEQEIKVIYEENPVGYKIKDWCEIYDYCVSGDHNFMFINYQKPKQLRIMKNFQEIVFSKKALDSGTNTGNLDVEESTSPKKK